VFKSIAYGQYNYYASKRSLIPNIFRPVYDSHCVHVGYFTRFYYLAYLAHSKDRPSPQGDGYVSTDESQEVLAGLGVLSPLHDRVIKDAIKCDLVEPDIRIDHSGYQSKHVRISAFGLYLIQLLAGRFCYLEAMMLDTPLTDAKDREYIRERYPENGKPLLIDRLLSVQRFVTILESLEARERVRLVSSNLDTICAPVMPHLRDVMATDVEVIKSSDAWEQQEY
jgi:hypothetical protein